MPRKLNTSEGWFSAQALLVVAGVWMACALVYGGGKPAQAALTAALLATAGWAWLLGRGLLGTPNSSTAGDAPSSTLNLQATREHAPRVFENDRLNIALTIKRLAGPPLQLLLIEDQCLASMEPRRRELIPELAAGWSVRLRYARQADRHHGLYLLGPLRVHTADPFGVFPAQRELPTVTRVTVYPYAEALDDYRVPGPLPPAGPSLEAIGRLGLGEEVLGIREYRPGDPPSRVHWRSSARRGRLHTIQLDRPVQAELALFLDMTRLARYGLGGESTARLATQSATSILTRAWQARHRFSLTCLRSELTEWPTGQGLQHLHLLLDRLVILEPAGDGDFWSAIAPRALALRPGSRAVFVVVAARAPEGDVVPLVRRLAAGGVASDLVLIDERDYMRIYREQEIDVRRPSGSPAAAVDIDRVTLSARRAGARVYVLRRKAGELGPLIAQTL